MIGDSLTDAFGKNLNKSFGSLPGSLGKGAGVFAKVAKAAELIHLVHIQASLTLQQP